MRGHRTSEHQAAVSRRLALLSAELAAVRAPDADQGSDAEANPWAAPPTPTRISADRRDAAQPWRQPSTPARVRPAEDDEPPPVPMPGRHARRRNVSLLPPGVRGRVALGAPQVAV